MMCYVLKSIKLEFDFHGVSKIIKKLKRWLIEECEMTQSANVLATQVLEAKFNTQDSYKKPGVVALGRQR